MTTRRVTSTDGTALPVRIARGTHDSTTLVLAHGAGSSMGHPSIVRMQDGLAARGTTVVTFDFPYRARGRGAPDRMPVLVAAFEAVLDAVRGDVPDRLFLGGRSMGGRMCSMAVAEGLPAAGNCAATIAAMRSISLWIRSATITAASRSAGISVAWL